MIPLQRPSFGFLTSNAANHPTCFPTTTNHLQTGPRLTNTTTRAAQLAIPRCSRHLHHTAPYTHTSSHNPIRRACTPLSRHTTHPSLSLRLQFLGRRRRLQAPIPQSPTPNIPTATPCRTLFLSRHIRPGCTDTGVSHRHHPTSYPPRSLSYLRTGMHPPRASLPRTTFLPLGLCRD